MLTEFGNADDRSCQACPVGTQDSQQWSPSPATMPGLSRGLWGVAVFLGLLVFCWCQSIRIGKTLSKVGPSVPYSTIQDQGYKMFSEAAGSHITLGGISYSIEHVEYNDASDGELVAILYERLVEVDQVDFLFAPLTGARGPVVKLANERHIPLINGAIFDIYAYPERAGNWTVTTAVNLASIAPACAVSLMASGAKTFVVLEDEFLASVVSISDSVLEYLGMERLTNTTVLRDVIDFQDSDVLDSVIEKWKQLKPDVVAIGASPFDTDLVMERIRRKHYEPPAIFIILGAETRFRQEADSRTWLSSAVVIPAEFEASLAFPDPLYNSSIDYAVRLRERFNTSAGYDVSYAVGGTVLMQALKEAGTKDREAVMAKLRAFNQSTIVGPLSFNVSTGLPNRLLYCLQFSSDGSRVLPISPQSLPNAVQLVYPAPKVPYTRDYLPESTRSKLLKIILPISLSITVLVIVAVVALLLFRRRFHVIFVARDTPSEEWS